MQRNKSSAWADPEEGGGWNPLEIDNKWAIGFLRNTGTDSPREANLDPTGPIAS